MHTNTDITIYNAYTVNRKTKYKRTVIKNVMWQGDKVVSVTDNGLHSEDVAYVLIPFSSLNEKYTGNIEFDKSEQKENIFTLRRADIICNGVVEKELTDDYRVPDLKKEYDEVYSLKTYSVNDFCKSESMKHFELVVI